MKLSYLCALLLAWQSSLAATANAEPVAAVADSRPVFDVFDFQIDGNTVLDDETLEKAVYPFLGPGKTQDDVEKARISLEDSYRKAGYPTVIVSIPEQDVNEEGRVLIAVVEGSIESQHITGSRYHDLNEIRASVPALAEGKVPHMPTVQEQMATLAQQSGDRNVTPIFRAGSTPGKMEVELRVKDELPLHGNVEMNSRSSANTSYSRLIGSVRYDNLWQKYHSASLQYQVSPEVSDEVSVWSGTYVLPTGWADTRLALYGVGISSNTQLGASVGGMSVVGSGSIYGARLLKPLSTEGSGFLHNLTFGMDYKSFDQGLRLVGQDTGKTSIQYAKFMTGYDAIYRTPTSTSSLNLVVNYSFRGMGNDEAQFISKRSGASADYLYLTGDMKFQYRLPMDFRLQTRAQGQASMSQLISNEQFSAGGPLSVRGYHQTQVLADQGINLSLELYTPRLLPDSWEYAQNLRLLGFLDWAHLWTMAPIAPTSPDSELSSAGLGLRSVWFKHLLAELDWAYPFSPQNQIAVGQQRVDFRMVYEF